MQRPAVAIAGAGRVGTALAVELKAQGYEIAAAASRSFFSARYLAEWVGAAVLDPVEMAKRADNARFLSPGSEPCREFMQKIRLACVLFLAHTNLTQPPGDCKR